MSRNVDGKCPSSLKRRTVLKNVAGGAAVALGFSGNAVASTVEGQTVESAEEFRSALEANRDLLEDLADRGLLDSADPADLTVDPFGESRPGGHERVTTYEASDGRIVAELKLVRQTEDGWLTVGVRPEIDDRFAIVGTDESDTTTIEPSADCCVECQYTTCCVECPPDATCDCSEYCTKCDCYCAP